MARIEQGRLAATIEGDFVVFLIGMRINQLYRPDKWLPVSRAMPRMLQELFKQPELGLLHAELLLGAGPTLNTMQYWRSYDQLHAYAHAKDREHLPAWAAFNKAARGNSAVGIYHETYLIPDGGFETIYYGMPAFGLGRAGRLVEAVGSMHDASSRLRRQATEGTTVGDR